LAWNFCVLSCLEDSRAAKRPHIRRQCRNLPGWRCRHQRLQPGHQFHRCQRQHKQPTPRLNRSDVEPLASPHAPLQRRRASASTRDGSAVREKKQAQKRFQPPRWRMASGSGNNGAPNLFCWSAGHRHHPIQSRDAVLKIQTYTQLQAHQCYSQGANSEKPAEAVASLAVPASLMVMPAPGEASVACCCHPTMRMRKRSGPSSSDRGQKVGS